MIRKLFFLVFAALLLAPSEGASDLKRLKYNNPSLVVDLGVGLWAWPLPMDYDRDGDYDLVVSCPDTPYNGTYFFENTEGNVKMPVFKPGVRIGRGYRNIQVSFVDGKARLLIPGREIIEYRDGSNHFKKTVQIYPDKNIHGRVRANEWKYCDYDGDGDLDIICGEFLDKLTYFENTGSRKEPEYAEGRYLTNRGRPIRMDLQMIAPAAIDWDRDGDTDLIVGQEDGRVAFLENTGRVKNGTAQFLAPKFFKQRAHELKFGALATPCSFDWDNDGDEDLICGNTAGYIGFIENLNGGDPPKWAEPRYLKAGGQVIRIQAGPNGSIQGPCEAKWGYTTLSVSDWDQDGLADIVVNSIRGKVIWYRNTGTPKKPRLAAARPVRVQWEGNPRKPAWNWWNPEDNNLVSQWRTTPFAYDLNGDGLNDLIMLDHQGYLAPLRSGSSQEALPMRIWRAQTGLPSKWTMHTLYVTIRTDSV